MPHATHKARRILTSDVPHAPVKHQRSRFQQQALLTVSVGFTMLIIVGLYAASFNAQDALRLSDVHEPRWSVIDEDFLDRLSPVKDNLANVKMTLNRMAEAGATQAKAAAILKAKIETRASASGTLETPETPETSPAAKAPGDTP